MIGGAELPREMGPAWLLHVVATAVLPAAEVEALILGTTMALHALAALRTALPGQRATR